MAEERKAELIEWLKLAQDAIRDRQVTIRSAFEKAVETNLRRLRGRVRDRKYVIDKETILAALGRAPVRPRIWGISGEVPIGVDLCCPLGGPTALIAKLRDLESTKPVQRIEGFDGGIRVWFRGPRPLGDFLLECSRLGERVLSRLVCSPPSYVAILPDDMLAMQELYLARQGMADTSLCRACLSSEVQPVVTTARQQAAGCAWRAIRFFCSGCGCVCDNVDRGPDPPCPISDAVWASMRKFPPGMQAFMSRPMDMDSLKERIRKLPMGRAPGRDGIPYEFFKYGPPEMLGCLLTAANAFMSGSHPLPRD